MLSIIISFRTNLPVYFATYVIALIPAFSSEIISAWIKQKYPAAGAPELKKFEKHRIIMKLVPLKEKM